jgi:hypothetical protein
MSKQGCMHCQYLSSDMNAIHTSWLLSRMAALWNETEFYPCISCESKDKIMLLFQKLEESLCVPPGKNYPHVYSSTAKRLHPIEKEHKNSSKNP